MQAECHWQVLNLPKWLRRRPLELCSLATEGTQECSPKAKESVIICSRFARLCRLARPRTIIMFSRSGIASPLLPPLASVLLKADMERSGGMNFRLSYRWSFQQNHVAKHEASLQRAVLLDIPIAILHLLFEGRKEQVEPVALVERPQSKDFKSSSVAPCGENIRSASVI